MREISPLCLGDWLVGSEWIQLISVAEIKTPGAAEEILSAGHVKRTGYVHQVNTAALYILLHQAWGKIRIRWHWHHWDRLAPNSDTGIQY